jgi:hypothetical protein
MKRNRERRPRGRLEEDRLRSELKTKDKQIGQLKKYVRQLEGQIGLELPVPQEPEETRPTERCPQCKSLNIIFLRAFKVNAPIKIIYCQDCELREVVPCS